MKLICIYIHGGGVGQRESQETIIGKGYRLEVLAEQVKDCHWIQVLQMEDTFRLLEHLDDPPAPFLRLTHYSELRAVYSRRGIGSSI